MHEILSRIQTDTTFQAAMQGATSIEDAVRIANAHGVQVTPEEIQQLLDSDAFADLPLSDAQLAAVSGGGSYWGTKKRNGAEQLPES